MAIGTHVRLTIQVLYKDNARNRQSVLIIHETRTYELLCIFVYIT